MSNKIPLFANMADTVSKKTRSKIMASVRQKGTGPELIVRSLLHRMGFRFRLQRKDLPGTPDIVLPKYRAALFVHGCFWHQHPKCIKSKRPSSNTQYWEKKLDDNIKRDRIKIEQLKRIGWRTLVIWECETKDQNLLSKKLNRFLKPKGIPF